MQPTGAVFMSKGPKRPAFQTEERPEAIGLHVVGGLPLHHLAASLAAAEIAAAPDALDQANRPRQGGAQGSWSV